MGFREQSCSFRAREDGAALCRSPKHDISKADDDEFYAQLREHFSESEIVELGLWCAENVGAGSFVRTLNIITWDEACELNPQTASNAQGKPAVA